LNGQRAATQTGIVPFTGRGSSPPDQYARSFARPSSSSRARSFMSVASPKRSNSPLRSEPAPTPSTSRPPLSRSSVTVSRASSCGRRRASGVTSGPVISRSVRLTMAAIVIHGSASFVTGGR
jgi:hypothetical protein